MNFATPKRLQSPSRIWLARAAAAITLISLQFVWVGVYVCAVQCAKGACAATVAGGANLPASDCGHSRTTPDAPARDSQGVPHGRHCPASNLRYWSAGAKAITAPQVCQVPLVSLAAVLPRAATVVASPAADATYSEDNSPPFIAPSVTPIPLRI